MSRFIFATQRVDPDDPLLAAAAPMIRALAERVDEVVVLAADAVDGALPENCRVRLFGAPTQLGRGRRLASALNEELSPRPVAVLSHMVPLYAILAAPLTKPRNVPLLLWFTHWRVTRRLRLANLLATAVVTVDRRSFPLDSQKVTAIGHGIDMSAFPCVTREPAERLRAIALGRTSPAKGLEAIARAARLAEVDLEIRGPSLTHEERAERARLASLGIAVEEPLPHGEIAALLTRKDVLVNNMREGSLDKVVYEAAATGMPVLASNSGFDDILPAELRFRHDDAADLAAKLLALSTADRNALGRELRGKVEERHSVEHWADAVLEVARR